MFTLTSAASARAAYTQAKSPNFSAAGLLRRLLLGLLALLWLGSASPAWADVIKPVEPLGNPGVVRVLGDGDDDGSQYILSNQTFYFYGQAYQGLTVNNNGVVTFGSTGFNSYTNFALPANGTATAGVYCLWDDLVQTSTNVVPKGYVYYKQYSDGVAITWVNCPHYGNFGGAGSANNTFQIFIYNSSGTNPGDLALGYLNCEGVSVYTVGINKGDGAEFSSLTGVVTGTTLYNENGHASVSNTRYRFHYVFSTSEGPANGHYVLGAFRPGPPTTYITSGPLEGTTLCSSSVTFTYSGVDDFTGTENLIYQYQLDGGAIQGPTSSTTLTLNNLSDGLHHITIAAIDGDGNVDPTPPTVDFTVLTAPPVISALTAGNFTPTSARITWTTDKPATSQVSYRVQGTTAWTNTTPDTTLVTSHSVTLLGLQIGTAYEYQAHSADGCDHQADSVIQSFVLPNPVPTLTLLAPNSVSVATTGQTLTLTGTNFVPGITVNFGALAGLVPTSGPTLVAGSLTDMQITVALPNSALTTAGIVFVSVVNPTPGGGQSNSLLFSITNPTPQISALNPNSAVAGGVGFPLVITGSGFVASSTVHFGADILNPVAGSQSATQLTVNVRAADIANPGAITVTVNNPTPGGGASNALTFTVTNPLPTLTSLSPSSAGLGGPSFTLTLTGTGLNNASVVQFGADTLTPIASSQTGTQLAVTVPMADIAVLGTVSVTIVNPAPGGGTSNALPFTVVAVPDLQVTTLTAPATVTNNTSFDVVWTDANLGAASANGPWVDRVYFSADADPAHGTLLGEFEFDGVLAPGRTAHRDQVVTIPRSLVPAAGPYNIIVVTNASHVVDEGPFGNNNARVQPVQVTLLPLPDLQVTQVQVPAAIQGGQTINVQWQVCNRGTILTTPGSWVDHVYLSSTTDMSGVVADLGAFPNGSALDVGQCYTEQQPITLPNGTGGIFYVLVDTDSANQVAESSETNNVGVSAAVTVTSNSLLGFLHVNSVTTIPAPPSLIFAGSQVTVNWTVKNTGQSTIEKGGLGYWDDALALSPTPTYDGVTGYFLGGHNGTEYPNTLPVGQTYSHQRVITLPSNLSGTWYVVAIPDTHFVAGGPFPIGASNIPRDQGAAKLVITTPPPAELAVTAVSAPATATAGQPLNVSWTVANQGAGDTQDGSWSDNVYLSSTPTFSAPTSTLVGSVPHSGGLGAGLSYSLSQSFPLSPCQSGVFYVFVVTDVGGSPQEFTPGANIRGAGNTTTIAGVNVPSLTVTSVSAKGPVTAGTALSVTWTVQNAGLAGTGTTTWHDAVYLSKNATFDGAAQQVDTFANLTPLAAGATYTQKVEVTVPPGDAGPYYVYVVANSDGAVNQCGASGNSGRGDQVIQVIAIVGSSAQLTASSVSAPASATSGQTVPITWTVTNTGTTSTPIGTWSDAVYLSNSPTNVSGAALLGLVPHSGALAVGASYHGSANVLLPLKTFGPFYIVVVPGYNGVAASAPIQLLTYPLADLTVTGVTAPAAAYAGTQAAVSWTVANNGNGPTDSGTWTDYVLLSRDSAPSRSATIVGFLPHTGALAQGGSYNAGMTINVPQNLTGPYYVFVYTDWNNAVLETSKYNNWGFADPPMTITLPPPSDLVVSSVTAPAQATPGLPTTLTWTVTNQGANAAPGMWTDAVYLSTTPNYNNSAILVGTVTQSGPLAPGTSYTGSLTTRVPPADPGPYYVVVRTDIFNNVLETDKTNNIGVSASTAALDVPELTLGTPFSGTLSNDDYRYFKVQVPAGQTLAAVLGGTIMDKVSELYVRYAHLPDRGHFDAFTDTLDPLTTNSLSLTVPTTLTGFYDILVRGSDEPQPATPYTILAKLVPFGLQSVSATHIGDNGQVTLTLHGAKFTAGATVTLIGADGTGLPAALVTVQNGGTARARFFMRNAAHGAYDMRITNPNGAAATLPQAVTVETATPLLFQPNATANLFPRVGSTFTVFGSVKNTSNIDIPYLTVATMIDQPVRMTLNRPGDALPVLTDDNRAALTQGVSTGSATAASFTVRDVGPGEVREFSFSAQGYSGPFAYTIAPVVQMKSDFLLSLQQQSERIRQVLLGTPQGAALPEPYKTALQTSDAWYMLFQNADIQLGLLDGPTPPSHAVRFLPPPPDGVDTCLRRAAATWIAVTATIGVGLAACIIGSAATFTPLCLAAAAALELINDEELARAQCICYHDNKTDCGSQSYLPCGFLDGYPCPQTPHDPNEMTGPVGFGPQHAVPATQPLLYTIDFENQATATASARQIVITNALDPSLDPRTFRLREISFGSIKVTVPVNKSYYQTLIDLGPAYNGLQAAISAGVDVVHHQVIWTLVAIDPVTGQEVDAANLGLLPPNNATHDGEGYVSYTISPVAGVANGVIVSNAAGIVFDTNEPIPTNVWTNTLIVASPTSAVAALPATSPATFLLSWSGSDGVAGLPLTFDIFVSDNGGPYTASLSGVSYTSAPYNGLAGHTYQFYSIAHDAAGDNEAAKTTPDATTTVTNGVTNPVPNVTAVSPGTVGAGGGDFTLTVTGDSFVTGSVVQWNGQALTTTYVSATQLSAIVPAADIAQAGSAQVTVVSPGPGGGTSSPQIVLIGTPNLTAAITLARDGSEIVATITVANSGNGPAAGVQIVSATLAGGATTTVLPVSVGDLGPGQSGAAVVRFPAPPAGTRTSLRFSGAFTGGSFGGGQRVTIP